MQEMGIIRVYARIGVEGIGGTGLPQRAILLSNGD